MKIKYEVAPGFGKLEGWIKRLPENFSDSGETIFKSRNEVKVFTVGEYKLNIKAFKVPNLVNRFVYVYFRGSKAQRSYRYAQKLLSLGVSTPVAVGYVDCTEGGLLHKSFYISNHFEYEFTLREVLNYKVPDREAILLEWVRFTWEKLHVNCIFHLDYSPGNTLIRRNDNKFDFQLVDLNRMSFRSISFERGLYNFRQLDTDLQTLELLATAYAALRGKDAGKAMKMLIGFDRKNKTARHRRGKFKERIRSIFRFGHVA